MNQCVCTIPDGGFCARHQCRKTAHWVRLCRTREDYFQAWEAGRGPGQSLSARVPAAIQPGQTPAEKGGRAHGKSGCGCGKHEKPPLVRQAWNLSKSLAAFAADGFKTVDKDEYQRRLAICDGCDRRDNGRCTVCGCFLAVKAKGRVWSCPLGRWSAAPAVGDSPASIVVHEEPEAYITTARLVADALRLASVLPPEITAVAGIARSGLVPASHLACHLHLPLWSVSPAGLVECGSGMRLGAGRRRLDTILVIDDTVFLGRALGDAAAVLKAKVPQARLVRAAVYVTPQGKDAVDYYACELPGPHYLEWNLFNSSHAQAMGADMDGILCDEILPEDDDDGDRYLRAIESARPKHLPRRHRVPMIVTARLEKYRPQTLAWLQRHGVSVAELVMGPWADNAQRSRADVARFKADHYRRLLDQRPVPRPVFVESCPRQAAEIARLSGGRVVCPAAGKCF